MTSPQRLYTVEEYLALDAAAPEGVRYEYANGLITAMSGASGNHELLVARIIALLVNGTRGKRCFVFGSNLRLGVRASRAYKYPDVSGRCGRPEFEDTRPETFLNPSFLFEILSRSTERRDRGDKFAHYQLIPSLREYVLVAQDHMRVERYVPAGDVWTLKVLARPDDVLELPSVGCALRLGDIYESVEFSDRPRPTPRLVREDVLAAYAPGGD